MFLKSSIRTLALPWLQQFDWGLRVTLNAYFSLITHTKQLLLVSICYTTAGIGASFLKHGRTANGQTDRRGSRNSYLDLYQLTFWNHSIQISNEATGLAEFLSEDSLSSALQGRLYLECFGCCCCCLPLASGDFEGGSEVV